MAEKAEKVDAVAQYADALSPKQRREQRERAFTAFNTLYTNLMEDRNSFAGFSRIVPTYRAAECFVRYLDLVNLRGMQNEDLNKRQIVQTGFEFVRDAIADTCMPVTNDQESWALAFDVEIAIGRLRFQPPPRMFLSRKKGTTLSDTAQIIEVGEQSAAFLEQMVGTLTDAAKSRYQAENGALIRLVTILESILDRVTGALRAEGPSA
ncbi:hypothetical protein HY417_02030 [Candidatus Kaiserbacteria bacterium]|nr:hypothetical protein [Candidatus Kaiserbacteria bacterium]